MCDPCQPVHTAQCPSPAAISHFYDRYHSRNEFDRQRRESDNQIMGGEMATFSHDESMAYWAKHG